jgi:thiol-disulfide isomerase/thioredoxin
MNKALTLVTLAATSLTLMAGCNNNKKTETISAEGDSVPAAKIQPMASDEVAPAENASMPTLAVGDKAPVLSIDHVIKGEGVTSFDGDRVYVVEFWATWCGPCRSSMPHLSELQDQYSSDVTIIGVSDEEVGKIQKFLDDDASNGKKWDENIRYVLATDPDRSMHDAYMKAAQQRGIPTAFVVDQNDKIAWIGHPMSMDEVLPQVIDGSWDADKARQEAEEEQKMQAAMEAKNRQLMEARRANDWDTYLTVLTEMSEQYPDNIAIKMSMFETMIMHTDNKTAAYKLADEILGTDPENSQLYNSLAWAVATESDEKCRDLDWALKTSLKGNELDGGANAAVLDTVARIYYEQGNMKEAIAWQKKAVEHASGEGMGEEIRAMLTKYEEEAKDTKATANAE